jgi:hypothetical protein
MPNGTTVVTNALIEAGWLAQGETALAGDATFALGKLNRILDQWSAKKILAYNVGFAAYVLTPNLQPHTIGPSGTFVVPMRPVKLESASLILNTQNPSVDVPLNIRTDSWWANQTVKGIATTTPTDLYYSADFPNGSIYLWPIPTVAYGIRLETLAVLSRFADLRTNYQLPPGYEEAITMTLAESLIGPNSGALSQQAREARLVIEGNNTSSPRMSTAQAGMPSKRRGGFNYHTGG